METKYTKALQLLDACVAASKVTWNREYRRRSLGYHPDDPTKTDRSPVVIHPVNPAFDELLTFMLANFEVAEATQENCNAYDKFDRELSTVFPDAQNKPELIPDKFWTPMMIRMCLREHKMPIDHRVVKSFANYCDNYSWITDGRFTPSKKTP